MTIVSLVAPIIFLFASTLLVDAEKRFINLGQQKGFFEGDIILPPSKNRNAILRAKRWTDGIVPYTINMTDYTQEHVEMIEEGMRAIERSTCIRFVKYTDQPNYLYLFNGGGCATYGVGMNGGQQYLSLQDKGGVSCFNHRTVVHELFHALGLFHEQSRYDRDKYITIRWENLKTNSSSNRFQLQMQPENETQFYGIEYNYASVMHYDAWAMGNGSVVLEPKNVHYLMVMGRSAQANETDFEKIRRIYECKGKYTPAPTPAPEPCVDEWPDCDIQSDRCTSDGATMTYCRKTCGFCEWGAPITATPRPYCQDYRNDCDSKYFKDKNECQENQEFRERTCPFTCGTCDKSKTRPSGSVKTTKTPATNKPTHQGPCVDEIDYCYQYIQQCGTREGEWMSRACPKSCKFCK